MAQQAIRVDDMIERARARADMVESDFWTGPQLLSLAEAKFRHFYLAAVAQYEVFFSERTTLFTVAGQTYVQPQVAQILKFRGLQHEGDWFLRKVDALEVPSLVGKNQTGKPQYYAPRVTSVARYPFIDLYATPNAAYTMILHYVPLYSLQTIQQTTGEGQSLFMLQGWDEYVVLKMAIAMKDREESDCSVLIAEANELGAAMSAQMTPVDLAEPMGVIQHASRRVDSFYTDPYDLEAIG